jgi:hypothetical protein
VQQQQFTADCAAINAHYCVLVAYAAYAFTSAHFFFKQCLKSTTSRNNFVNCLPDLPLSTTMHNCCFSFTIAIGQVVAGVAASWHCCLRVYTKAKAEEHDTIRKACTFMTQ